MKKIGAIIGRIVAALGIIGAIGGAAIWFNNFRGDVMYIKEGIDVSVETAQESKAATDSLAENLKEYKEQTDAHRAAKKEQANEILDKLHDMEVNQSVLIENQPNPDEIMNEIRRRHYLESIESISSIDTASIR